MKKPITLFLLLFFITQIWAQSKSEIADLEKIYNDGNYKRAAQKSLAFYQEHGSWDPVVLYVHTRSWHAIYSDTTTGVVKPLVKYEEMSRLTELCNIFFDIYRKGGPRKRNMLFTRAFFQKMKSQSGYQYKRTLAKAINLLNDAAVLFPNKSIGGYAHNGEVEFNEAYCSGSARVQIFFNLSKDTSFLFITGRNSCDNGKEYQPSRKRFEICRFADAIDLKHLPEDNDSITPSVYCKLSRQNTTQKADSFAVGKADRFSLDSVNIADGITKRQQCTVTFNQVRCIKANSGEQDDMIYKAKYPVLWLFDEENPDFHKDGYAERIRETFNYIITYFSKMKQKK